MLDLIFEKKIKCLLKYLLTDFVRPTLRKIPDGFMNTWKCVLKPPKCSL